MCFLVVREAMRCVAGHLSEVDGCASKIDEGIAALFRVVESDNPGSTGVSSHWADKQPSVGWCVRL